MSQIRSTKWVYPPRHVMIVALTNHRHRCRRANAWFFVYTHAPNRHNYQLRPAYGEWARIYV